jgi:hypothetical protein
MLELLNKSISSSRGFVDFATEAICLDVTVEVIEDKSEEDCCGSSSKSRRFSAC